jgi:hypothetical protein
MRKMSFSHVRHEEHDCGESRRQLRWGRAGGALQAGSQPSLPGNRRLGLEIRTFLHVALTRLQAPRGILVLQKPRWLLILYTG